MKASEKKRVLVVEDDHLVSEMIRGMLEELGYEVAGEAEDGHEALGMVRKIQPDVVLMDIKMPRMSGIEATILIQKHFPTPIVILSAYETEDLVKEASEAGVGAFVVKPPQPSELFRAIEIACGRFEDMVKLSYFRGKYDEAMKTIESLSKLLPVCPGCGEEKRDEDYAKMLNRYLSGIPVEEISRYLCSHCRSRTDSEARD
ncbi:MAG: response regulator [Candidatus Aegiribacteria sp.]|nr:response regulator [Candidatus Aegiribacteria sp.]